MLQKKTSGNENMDSRKINGLEISSLVLKIVSISFGISAMILISLSIASPNGITYYEDRISVKIFEILFSLLAVIYLLHDLKIAIKGSNLLK